MKTVEAVQIGCGRTTLTDWFAVYLGTGVVMADSFTRSGCLEHL